MEDKAVLEANENLKKILAKRAFERDIIWGYLKDFETVVKYYDENYGKMDWYGPQFKVKLVHQIYDDLKLLYKHYNGKKEE